MTTLFQAINSTATTFNNAVTNYSSLNANVDLFFLIGASRNKDISSTFISAFVENEDLAIRNLLWARDVRSGAGERQTFRNLFKVLIEQNSELAIKVLNKLPELGRFDDIFIAFNTKIENAALRLYAESLRNKNALAAKWAPRKGSDANKLRAYLRLTPKDYRKLLVNLSATVEQQMCAKNWNEINYNFVPSVAASRYQKAFVKHDQDRYNEYKQQLIKGEAKINAGAVYPYDVIRSLKNGDETVSIAQWNALPNYMEGSDERILPVVDVSGSMSQKVSGSISAMDVAVSLGLYISERNTGIFKDQFITFSESPKMVKVSGNLSQRLHQMNTSDWGMNTDLEKVFDLILNAATKHNVSKENMPTKLLILSDMEFDVATDANQSLFEIAKVKYAKSNYELPQIIFWNLAGRKGNVPVSIHDTKTALVSGFSPSILKSLLGGNLSPEKTMLDTLSNERYNY